MSQCADCDAKPCPLKNRKEDGGLAYEEVQANLLSCYYHTNEATRKRNREIFQ